MIYINLLINIHNLIYLVILLIHKTASLILYSLLILITLLFINSLYKPTSLLKSNYLFNYHYYLI